MICYSINWRIKEILKEYFNQNQRRHVSKLMEIIEQAERKANITVALVTILLKLRYKINDKSD